MTRRSAWWVGVVCVAALAFLGGRASAAVTPNGAWQAIGTSGAATTYTATFNKPATGTDRIILVVAAVELGTASATLAVTATYGTTNTQTATAWTVTRPTIREHLWYGYFTEAQIAAAGGTPTLTVNVPTNSASGVYAAVFNGVNQTTPFSATVENGADATGTTFPFGSNLAYNAGSIVVASTCWRGTVGTGTTPPAGYTEQFDDGFNARGGWELSQLSRASAASSNDAATETAATKTNLRWGMGAVALNPVVPSVQLITGTNPAGSTTVCPGDTVYADQFGFTVTGAADRVSALTVSGLGTTTPIATLAVADNAGTTISSTSPTGNTQAFSWASTNLAAPIGTTYYRLYFTAKNHATIGATPATVTPIVLDTYTSTNTKTAGSDTASSFSFDNTAQANVGASSTNTPTSSSLTLALGASAGLTEYVVWARKAVAPTDNPADGTQYVAASPDPANSFVAYVGSASNPTINGLDASSTYHFRAFARDACFNYSTTAATFTGTTAAPPPQTTVGNGTDPGDATLAPGGAETPLDAATFQASITADTVTGLTVSLLPAGSYVNVAQIRIMSASNCTGTQYLNTVAPSGDSVAFSGGTSIPAPTASATPAYVCVTPKTHANMPAVPGASYAITGTITAITSTNANKVYQDTASATVTIDNLSPGNATWGTVTPSSGQIVLDWTNPADADFGQVVILRSNASIGDVPLEGATYAQNDPIGASTVRYVGSLQTFTDTAITPGVGYHYRLFAKDSRGNYSATGAQTGPHPTTTVVGNGTDPSPAATIGPGASATNLDAFTLQTSGGTDTVTAVTVTLAPAGAFENVALVEITNSAGTTVYGSASNPASNTVAIGPLTTNIPVTITGTQYYVRITPRSHAAMPAVPGASYATTGIVTAIASTNAKSYTDSSSNTLTIDNLSPSNAPSLTGTPGNQQVILTWTNPPDADFAEVVILRNTSSITAVPIEGAAYVQGNNISGSAVRYVGSLQTFTDTGLTNGTNYHYRIFAKDSRGNYAQTGYEAGPYVPFVPPTTTVGNGTDPSPAVTLAPGAAATNLDAFTLKTDSGQATIAGVTVTLAPAGAFNNVGLVEITDEWGMAIYGAASSPTSNTVTIPTSSLVATTTLAAYYVRITPKPHAAMPAVPGAAYAITGTVTALTSPYQILDTGSNTVTIDNLSPGNVSGFTGAAGGGQVALSWANPADTDFSRVVILRSTAAIGDLPAEGAAYVQNDTIGASTVRYIGNLTAFTDTAVIPGVAYYYRIFAKDSRGNYSQSGVQVGPYTPSTPPPITRQSSWAFQYFGEPFPSGTANPSYVVQPGFNRVLVVAVASTRTGPSPVPANTAGGIDCSVSYGGQPLTLAAGDGTSTATWNHTYLFYLKDTPSVMDGTARPVDVTCTPLTPPASTDGYYTWAYAAVYAGVDQANPVSSARNYNSGTANGTVGPFATGLAVGAQEQCVEVVNLADSAGGTRWDTTTRSITGWATGWTTAGVEDHKDTLGPSANLYIRDRAQSATPLSDTSQHTANNASTFDSMTALCLAVGPVTTVGNGTDPTAPTTPLAPGGAPTRLDAFTLQTSRVTDSVSGATVTLAPAGAWANVGLVEITNEAGTVYGSAIPTSNTVAISFTQNITATTTQTPYYVRITPRAHAAMPPVPGASYATTGTVTAIVSPSPKVYLDSTSHTLTIDNTSPGNATIGTVVARNAQVTLNWTNPTDGDFGQVVILRNTSSIADVPAEGGSYTGPPTASTIGTSTVVYAGSGSTTTDATVVNGTAYYYRIFARDSRGNYSQTGVETGPHTPLVEAPAVAPGTATATANGCGSIAVSVPFSGDIYTGNSSTAFRRGSSAGGPFSPVPGCDAVVGASPRTCSDTTVSELTTYYYQVDFTDPDGVAGADPQVVSATTSRCGGLRLASAGAVTATFPAPGATGVVVGRFSLTAELPSAMTVSTIRVQNTGTAVPGSDVSFLQLFEDNGTPGVLDGADVLLATSVWDGSRYVFSDLSYAVPPTGKTLLLTLAVSNGATGGRTFRTTIAASDVPLAFPDATTGTYASATGATITPPDVPREGDTSANTGNPLVAILNPRAGAAPSGTFRVQVKTWVPGQAAVTNLQLSTDGGQSWAHPFDLTAEKLPDTANYDPDIAHATVFEKQLPLSPGAYSLKARASNDGAATWVESGAVVVTVNPVLAGDGRLLVRDDSSQLCTDCHAIKSHSSQTMGRKYGQWATNCRDCHAPHGTRNIKLVNEEITPPAVTSIQQPARKVYFSKRTGAVAVSGAASPSQASFVNEGDNSGPCQVCHTRTSGAVPRWRNSGNADAEHYSTTAAVPTTACTTCHSHADGFRAPESDGGTKCEECHSNISGMMSGTAPKPSKHSLVGFTDAYVDSGGDWTAAGNLSAIVPPAQRTCVNMCHVDHVHNVPGQTAHAGNVVTDASSTATRAVTRSATGAITAGGIARKDFDAAATNKGLCVSCHKKPISATKPAISATDYAASPHNSETTPDGASWRFLMHDGSAFNRNCTKCHASRAEGTTPVSANVITGVHGNDYPNLLAGATNPATTNGTLDEAKRQTFICYNCHGNDTVGTDRSGKDAATQVGKANLGYPYTGHPVDEDAVHDPAELGNAVWGNTLGVSGRHVNCDDCHSPHAARAGLRTPPTPRDSTANRAGPALEGAWGVKFTAGALANFGTPTSANYAKVTITTAATPGAGKDNLEASLCFKCHSNYYWGNATPPTGISVNGSSVKPVLTDVAQEFSPTNRSGHPVLTGLNSYPNSIANPRKGLAASQMLAGSPWTTNLGTQTMTCGDCHDGDAVSPAVRGPHGSAVQFMLKGTNTAWPDLRLSQIGSSFCANCHVAGTNGNGAHAEGGHSTYRCFECHIVIPHGGKLSRLIGDNGSCSGSVCQNDSAMPDRYAWGNKKNASLRITGFRKKDATAARQAGATGGYDTADCSAGCYADHRNVTVPENW